MFLAVDCGNTNIVFALYSISKNSFKLINSWRISSSDKRTPDEYFLWLTQALSTSNVTTIQLEGVCVASVVPEVLLNIKLMTKQFLKAKILVIGEDNIDLNIKINIDNPKDAGSDRLVNACAIKYLKLSPAIVIDFGTATTFDIIGNNGSYDGGIISPGVNLSIDALYSATSRLPKITIKPLKSEEKTLIGKNTVTAMQSGIYWGYVCMIEGLIIKLKNIYKNHKIIATGGLSKIFINDISSIDLIIKDLTITGLANIYLNYFKKK